MTTDRDPAATHIRPSTFFYGLIWVGFPLLGALAGWLLGLALDWILDWSWVPFQGVLETLDDVTGSWTAVVLMLVGAVVGLFVGATAHAEVEFVTVDSAGVTITLDGKERRIERAAVAVAFIESKRLVLQDASGRQAARATVEDLPHDQLESAFTSHGYTWVHTDPRDVEFKRWVPGADGLPAGANAILVARQTALDEAKTSDAEEFRRELTTLGVVVRDVKTNQYWRSA